MHVYNSNIQEAERQNDLMLEVVCPMKKNRKAPSQKQKQKNTPDQECANYYTSYWEQWYVPNLYILTKIT